MGCFAFGKKHYAQIDNIERPSRVCLHKAERVVVGRFTEYSKQQCIYKEQRHSFACFVFFLSLIHFPFARRWDVSKSCLLSLSRSDLMERGISDSVQSLRLLLSCPHTDCHRKQVEEALLDWLVFNKSLVLTFLLLSFSQWWFFWFSVWMLDGAVI